jgi:putative ABC transport system ATP-binding protein
MTAVFQEIPPERTTVSATTLSAAPALSLQHTAVLASDVSRRYGHGDTAVDALRNVDLAVPAGQYLAVMGSSGSGKSTLMHVLAGLDRPDSGSVEIDGREITTMGDRELTRLRRDTIGFVFQAFNLLPVLTAQENILLGLRVARRTPDPDWVHTVIERVGLAGRLDHRPSQLSGGQQQRVAVARALVCEPAVLFADEPTGNLDSHSSAEILDLLRETADSFGQTIVMVTHEPKAAATADRVVFLADGRVAGDLADPTEASIVDALTEVGR